MPRRHGYRFDCNGQARSPGAGPSTAEVIDQFRAALAARDIVPPESIIADGSLHRCDVAGKNGKGDAAYLLHLDGIPAGGLENWRDGKGWESWRYDIGRALTPAELDALHAQAKLASSRRMEEAVKRQAAAREVAARIWHAARPAGDAHPYLACKEVVAHGLRVFKGALLVPVHDAAGELHSLQFIGASGTKRFLKGGRVAGLYFLIGVARKVVCIAEGYATGASIHAATGYAVAVAFNAGNLAPIARAIRENQEMSPEIAKLEAATAVFEAKKAGILDAIKHKRRRALDTTGEEGELEALVGHAPVPALVPRLLYADATPEALAHALATGWPSGGVLSAEAGAVFGAHGMGQETILRNLALLNVLWDGGEMAIDRRSKPSFVLRGRRLTFGLMLQPEALRGFLERAGTLPRGTGFIARFLIAWPGSTQGTRAYRPAPEAMPLVAPFGARIRELLEQPLATDAHGCLTPPVLDLSPQARAEWIRFHDEVERELGARGTFRSVRDVAAKAAENVARLAALFHVLEHGASGTIASGEIRAAACIVGWHLNEARRLLADLDTPPSLAAAIRLDSWLRSEAQANGTDRVPTKRIYQYGPNCVRDSRDLRAALAILAERGRAWLEESGRRRSVVINPALLVNRE